MAKSALGRGLDHLMRERQTPANPQDPPDKPQVTPGMAALLRGGNGEAKEQSENRSALADAESLVTLARKKRLTQASLIIADLLLIALVVRLAFISHGHIGFIEIILCIFALGIGAWLSCLALWLK